MPKDTWIKDRLKRLINRLPFRLTRNQYIDHQCNRVIRRHCDRDSNCIDIGCHKGEVLDAILRSAPGGRHFAFEPIPELYNQLRKRYGHRVVIFPQALSNSSGRSNFNYVYTNPAYSGILKRKYDRPEEQRLISVEIAKLDDLIPQETPIDLIKIDVEGAELWVLEGGVQILERSRPLILFEHGKGGAENYGYGPSELYRFFSDRSYELFTLDKYLKRGNALSHSAFKGEFERGNNFFFVASP